MDTFRNVNIITVIIISIILTPHAVFAEQEYSWQKSYANVLSRGDIEWTPEPFRFVQGKSVRYIDFEKGSDDNDGMTKETSWKHHPWDSNAEGNAAACTGIHTYVFKGGVEYRGALTIKDGGSTEEPIRLTRDPDWGVGPAVFLGSERITDWKKGADHEDIPDPGSIWYADLDFSTRAVWWVKDGDTVERIPLARTPNWTVTDPEDPKADWWRWDNPRRAFKNTIKDKNGTTWKAGIDTKHIKDKPAEYFKGALIWPEYGWVVGTPYPTRVRAVDLEKHTLGFAGWPSPTSSGRIIFRHMRYYLEDKPHYLDDPKGEFWFDKKGEAGRLYLRLPDGVDPAQVRIEAGKYQNQIAGTAVKHLHITGLTFRFAQSPWDINLTTWDFNTSPWTRSREMMPASIQIWGSGKDIRIANCLFEHLFMPVRIRAGKPGEDIDEVVLEDNRVRYTDQGAFYVSDGLAWGCRPR